MRFQLRERRLWPVVGFVFAATSLLFASCMPINQPQAPDRCKHIVEYPCLTPRVCTFDSAGGCQICRCGPPAYVPPTNLDLRPSPP